MKRDDHAVWEDDRTAYMRIDQAPPVIQTGHWVDTSGQPSADSFGYLFHGDLPMLQRVSPTGTVTPVTLLDGIPELLWYDPKTGKVRFQADRRSFRMDVQTGNVENDGSIIVGAHGFGEIQFSTPDGKRTADLLLSDAPRKEPRLEKGTLIVSANGQEVFRLDDWLPVYRRSGGQCPFGDPRGAWRPDGQKLAVTAVPEEGLAELWILDLSRKQHAAVARLSNLPRRPEVTWSPNGRYLTFGSLLMFFPKETERSELLSTALGDDVLWSPDSRYLLTSALHYGKWGKLSLIEAATGEMRDLGYGWALGFTPKGEVVSVTWDGSRSFPLDRCR